MYEIRLFKKKVSYINIYNKISWVIYNDMIVFLTVL